MIVHARTVFKTMHCFYYKEELYKLKHIFEANCFLRISSAKQLTIRSLNWKKKFRQRPIKCPIFLRLLYLDKEARSLKKMTKNCQLSFESVQ